MLEVGPVLICRAACASVSRGRGSWQARQEGGSGDGCRWDTSVGEMTVDAGRVSREGTGPSDGEGQARDARQRRVSRSTTTGNLPLERTLTNQTLAHHCTTVREAAACNTAPLLPPLFPHLILTQCDHPTIRPH